MQQEIMPLAESVDRLARNCAGVVISLKEINGQIFASVSVGGGAPAIKTGAVGESGSSVLVRAMAGLVSRDPAPTASPAIDLAADVRRQNLRREREELESLLVGLRDDESACKAKLVRAIEDCDDDLETHTDDLLSVREEISETESALDEVVAQLAGLN